MYLLIQAFPERPMSFVVTDDFGVDKDMNEVARQQVMFTNFAHTVDGTIHDYSIDNVVLYGPMDFTKKLADYVREDFPDVKVRTVNPGR